jgi:hypothetical protein
LHVEGSPEDEGKEQNRHSAWMSAGKRVVFSTPAD